MEKRPRTPNKLVKRRHSSHISRSRPQSQIGDLSSLRPRHRSELYEDENVTRVHHVPEPDKDVEISRPRQRSELEEEMKKLVRKKVAIIPSRLISTHDGRLYSTQSGELERAFKLDDRDYDQLGGMADGRLQMEFVEKKVDSFFEYAMFSHRWGENEPLFKDVPKKSYRGMDDQGLYRRTGPGKGQKVKSFITRIATHETRHVLTATGIYAMAGTPGIKKLKGFCREAAAYQVNWAWSDTCCIDKTSSAELQESLNCMFLWYRNSRITIVHLTVASAVENLYTDPWFTRGWTLQELLAPKSLRFFKSDWTTLYGDHDTKNDKAHPDIVSQLSRITGIAEKSITHFQPGVTDVREKMMWASKRETTKAEDKAYSLMGIFGIYMPILYGEKEMAFFRFQEEIMKRTYDRTLFDWVGKPSKFSSLIASDPDHFKEDPSEKPPTSTSERSFLSAFIDAGGLFSSSITTGIVEGVKSLIRDPPPGHFIANGRMHLPLFAYKVSKYELLTHDARGYFDYEVKASGLKRMTISTWDKLTDGTYYVARIWIDDVVKTVARAHDSDESEEFPEYTDVFNLPQVPTISEAPNPFEASASDRPKTVHLNLEDLSRNLTSYCQPFKAVLLRSNDEEDVYTRVNVRNRLIAEMSTFAFRAPRIMIVE